MNQIQIGFSYEWQAVFSRERVEYLFPMAITPFMRTRYQVPAIFRWDIYQRTPEDKKLVYIGDAQELCPKRLYGYLNPGPTQQTNKRVNTEFRGYLKEKLNIKLDICNIHELTFEGSMLENKALDDRYVRRLIVDAMIIEHKKRGFTVLDL